MSAAAKRALDPMDAFRKQLELLNTLRTRLEPQLEALRQRQNQEALLSSVAEGLYDELDKQAKKAPAEAVTDLALREINQLIDDVKTAAPDDPYVARATRFVPAGDNPENRDAVIVLRGMSQGLKRLHERLQTRGQLIQSKITSADTVRAALTIRLSGSHSASKLSLLRHVDVVDSGWLGFGDDFDFDLLDTTDLQAWHTVPD